MLNSRRRSTKLERSATEPRKESGLTARTKKVADISLKEVIIEAAVEFFAKHGFHAASTSEIVALVGVFEDISSSSKNRKASWSSSWDGSSAST
jgi:hypothetical protein